MKRIQEFVATLALGLCAIAGNPLYAQAPSIAIAPRPTQLTDARTAFVSNNNNVRWTYSDQFYDQAYAAVLKLNRFILVGSPQEADLILEFSVDNSGLVHTLRILDTKTHTVLWTVCETQDSAARQATIAKNQQKAIDDLAADLQRVTSPSTPKN